MAYNDLGVLGLGCLVTSKGYGHGRVFQQSLGNCNVPSLRPVFVTCGLPSQPQSTFYIGCVLL